MQYIVLLLLTMTAGLSSAQQTFTQDIQNPKQIEQMLPSSATGPHINVSLLSDVKTVSPGQTFRIGALLTPDAQWHTYWRNPGDSGEAPTIEVSSNINIEVGDIQWPIPQAIPVAHLVNYGYAQDNLLMREITLDETAKPGDELIINAQLSWLVCKEDCIPGWATLGITIPITQTSTESPQLPQFMNTAKLLPVPFDSFDLVDSTKELVTQRERVATGEFEINAQHLVLQLPRLKGNDWYAFAFRSDVSQHAAAQQVIHDEHFTRIVVPRSDYFDESRTQHNWLVSNGTSSFELLTTLNPALSSQSGIDGNMLGNQVQSSAYSLVTYMLMAFLGGLILNLMPCVLPIISIKALALQHEHTSLSQKLAYLLGVVVCFNLFAVLIIGLQLSGTSLGWGFHMQEPIVIVLLAFLFTFIALVLLDALELGSNMSGIGQSLITGSSPRSHFFTGVLAVVVASPCTAPFMAAALGIALISEPSVSLLIFNALALGFALPMTLLFASRRFSRLLPKPGVWMVTFKHILAFPMLLTVAWLAWVYHGQSNSQLQFVLLVMLVLFSMFVWLTSKAKNRLTRYLLIICSICTIFIPGYLSTTIAINTPPTSNDQKSYVAYDSETLSSLKNDNQVVLVNMTADWCITCKVNEQIALSTQEVNDALSQDNVHYMVGDWTNKNQQILTFLTQYQRAGVPLYVIYAGQDYEQVLPQLLTPEMVIDAIETAKNQLN